jgi:hypothetical protein
LAIFGGVALIIQERITEIASPFGKLTAATEKAAADAETISKLKDRVENQSATVDLVAREATKAKELSESATAQITDAQSKLEALNKATSEAAATLENLKEEEEFRGLVIAAQNDDRTSYDRLGKIANDKQSRFAKMASDAYRTIYESHNGGMYRSNFQGFWAEGVDPSKFSFEQLQDVYKAAPAGVRPALLEYIWGRNNIAKSDRMVFMIKIMKTDSSLTAVEYASRHFLEGAGLENKMSPMALDYLYDWWEKHQSEFIEK